MVPCSVRQIVSCIASLRLVGWAVPAGAAHVHSRLYLGSDPPQTGAACCLHTKADLGAGWSLAVPSLAHFHHLRIARVGE